MTNPRPLAPPVTTAVRPSRLNVGKVLTYCIPPLPRKGRSRGNSASSGYSTIISRSVREAEPSCGPAEVPVASVEDLWYGSGASLSRRPRLNLRVWEGVLANGRTLLLPLAMLVVRWVARRSRRNVAGVFILGQFRCCPFGVCILIVFPTLVCTWNSYPAVPCPVRPE